MRALAWNSTLDGHHRRPVLPEQGAQVGLQVGQAPGNVRRWIGAQDAGRHRPRSAAFRAAHDAVAAPRQAGIDAEHEHEFGS